MGLVKNQNKFENELMLKHVEWNFQQTTIWNISYFSGKLGFAFSCKLSPKWIICMKCQSLFSEKKKKTKQKKKKTKKKKQKKKKQTNKKKQNKKKNKKKQNKKKTNK